jgi:hypothetical protein
MASLLIIHTKGNKIELKNNIFGELIQYMKVCGFTFIRNAIKYDFPIVEAINSILPMCDEVVVAVGKSEDDTRNLVDSISPKITIIDTEWDDALREGGRVLAEETDKAFQAINSKYDWCIYIQGDEVIHEKYHDVIIQAMYAHLEEKNIEGLLLKYLHFYGNYKYTADSSRWYRNEIRIIRNDKNIFSFRDAQGFRKKPNEKLNVKAIDAHMYHYGYVKNPKLMKEKINHAQTLWHDDTKIESHIVKEDLFDYSNVESLTVFDGAHPIVMKSRIESQDWNFDFDTTHKKLSFKEKIKKFVESSTGIRIGEYKNYNVVK